MDSSFCCCKCFLIFATLLTGAGFITFFTIEPKIPQFDLQQVSVDYINVTASNSSSPSVSSKNTTTTNSTKSAVYMSLNLTLVFTMGNHNKVKVKYLASPIYVAYNKTLLAQLTLQEFEQPAHGSRTVEERVSVNRLKLLGTVEDNHLVLEAAHNSSLEVQIRAHVYTAIVLFGHTCPSIKGSTVDCWFMISSRKILATPMQCRVSWIDHY